MMASLPRPSFVRPNSSVSSANHAATTSSSDTASQAQAAQSADPDAILISSSDISTAPSGQSSSETLPHNHETVMTSADRSNLSSSSPPSTERPLDSEQSYCFICQGYPYEDGPNSSPWRSPCPCPSMKAHEQCLLDWIADRELQRKEEKVRCPQCNTRIRAARPFSPVVTLVRACEKAASSLVLPGVFSLIAGGMYSACFVHGAVSVILVLGREDWERLIGVMSEDRAVRMGMRLMFGLPMLPVVLVLSRTRLADGILPILPLIFFAPQFGGRKQWHRLIKGSADGAVLGFSLETSQLWPPSATMAFSCLPFLRAAYNATYARLFAEKEKEWMNAIRRTGDEDEEEAEIAAENVAAAEEEEGENGEIHIQINAQVEVVEDADPEAPPVDEVDQAGEDALPRVPAHAVVNHDANANGNGRGAEQQGRRNAADRRNNGLILSASKLADTILGALCFPAIASAVGEVLKLSLPTNWTSSSIARRPGLLQTKWGRSIVGGCLFVVVKDTLILYSRYRLAQDHSKRRILDYTGPKRQTEAGT